MTKKHQTTDDPTAQLANDEDRKATEWLPAGDDGGIDKPESSADPGVDPDADFPSPGGPPSGGSPRPTAPPRHDWLPSGKDDGIDKPESAADPGVDPDADFPQPGGGNDGGGFQMLTLNGIDAVTGDYWTPPMLESDLARILSSQKPLTEEIEYLRKFTDETKTQRRLRILRPGVDPKDLAQTGWGVVFSESCDPRIRTALSPLLELRRRQVGSSDCYKEYYGADAYREGQSAQAFLARHGGGTGPVEPARIPYYLLLVGSPEEIPFHVQSQLGVRHAVGRIHFDDPMDYRCYADSVVQAEEGFRDTRKEIVFFSAANDGDDPTQRSQAELVEPVARLLAERFDWRTRVVSGKEADRERLRRVLGGEGTPPVLFTASHGMAYRPPCLPEDQKRFQGALLCGNWPGPGQKVKREHFFAAEDVAESASLCGTICFHFACFSAGTPRYDNFAFLAEGSLSSTEGFLAATGHGTEIAPLPFISALPKRLLSLAEKRGALAVMGHVDRAWTCSFSYLGEARESLTFDCVLEELLHAFPLGHAMRYISRRYADLASDVTLVEDPSASPVQLDPLIRARLWRAQSDARNFIILGDPAVRLPAASSRPLRRWRDGRRRVGLRRSRS